MVFVGCAEQVSGAVEIGGAAVGRCAATATKEGYPLRGTSGCPGATGAAGSCLGCQPLLPPKSRQRSSNDPRRTERCCGDHPQT